MYYYSENVCTCCGYPLGDGHAFCPRCGTRCRNSERRVCATCGKELEAEFEFCPKCGTRRRNSERRVCAMCGKEQGAEFEFCPYCGQKSGVEVSRTLQNTADSFNTSIEKKKKQKRKRFFRPLVVGVAVLAFLSLVILAVFLTVSGVEDVRLCQSSVEIKIGETFTAEYEIDPIEAEDTAVRWKSTDESVAIVNSSGEITGVSVGRCTVIIYAGNKKDKIEVIVTPAHNLKAIYSEYCTPVFAKCSADGSTLTIDTNPYDTKDYTFAYRSALVAIEDVIEELGLPDSLWYDIRNTTKPNTKKTEEYSTVIVSWEYHPTRGLKVTFKLK